MEFEWDEAKNEANRAKLAIRIFNGPVRRAIDPRPRSEHRIVATGKVEDRWITIVYTRREGRYRIISARPARRNERF